MKYKVNKIFYSIQGEGFHVGTPAIFIRFSGCNLKCAWCDTDHKSFKEYSKEELEKEVYDKIVHLKTKPIIVFTGGEPTIQLKEDEELLKGFYRTIETNGFKKVPNWIDWTTLSPKNCKTQTQMCKIDEIKIVFESNKMDLSRYNMFKNRLYLQPLEKDGKMNIKETIEFIKKNPKWKLSLQTHKLIGIE